MNDWKQTQFGKEYDAFRQELDDYYAAYPTDVSALEQELDEANRQIDRLVGALGDALHAVVVPAVDVTRSVTKVFKTPHAQASLGDAGLSAVDVTLATCAALM